MDIQKICQEVSEKVQRLSTKNGALYLKDLASELQLKDVSVETKAMGIHASILLHAKFPSSQIAAEKRLLKRALQSCDGLLVKTELLATFRHQLLIYLGNIHVSTNEFFEALEYFHDAYKNEENKERRVLSLVNMARCKLWLRDFKDVSQIVKKVKAIPSVDKSYDVYMTLLDWRLNLLVGQYGLRQNEMNQDHSVEVRYLELIEKIMDDWEPSFSSKYEQFVERSKNIMTESDLNFYLHEALLLEILQQTKRGRSVTTNQLRKLNTLRSKVDDTYIQECSKILALVCRAPSGESFRRLAILQRFSQSLHQLLQGAHDFTYQFASVLWMNFLWNNGHKTDFARYFIEFQSYVRQLNIELGPNATHKKNWTNDRLAEFEIFYGRL